jgi:hypothetical protein
MITHRKNPAKVKPARDFAEELDAEAAIHSVGTEDPRHDYGVNEFRIVGFLRRGFCRWQEEALLDL